ncbi:hypothetical protein PFISCL1PPCAC_22582, partial [Pristionchus fissidentatus]
HADYADKLHRLAEHIKAHPEEARHGIHKLSHDAQKPAAEIIHIFCSDKDPKVKYAEIQAIKATLSAPVVAEIDHHKHQLAHKIGILTLDEILERLDKLAAHIKAHPDEARHGVHKLSHAAQKPAAEIIHIFCSDKDNKTKYLEIKAIQEHLPSDVLGEINAHKAEIAHRIGVTPLHHH